MTIYIPWGIIAIFISFYLFREYNRSHKAKRDERHDERIDPCRRDGLSQQATDAGDLRRVGRGHLSDRFFQREDFLVTDIAA